MAHFADFAPAVKDYSSKKPLSGRVLVTGDESVVVLWGGGPPPDNADLDVTVEPATLGRSVELPPISGINRKFRFVAENAGTGMMIAKWKGSPYASLPLTVHAGAPALPKSTSLDLEYDGKQLTWAARSKKYKATSGLPPGDKTEPDWRESKYSCVKDHGPVPEGSYTLSTLVDPNAYAASDKDPAVCKIFPGSTIQRIPRGPVDAGACDSYWVNWGTNRVALQPADDQTRNACSPVRDGFYLHDSTKGFSHGCIEVETTFFDDLYDFAKTSRGKRLSLRVKYLHQDTQGGTKKP